MSSRDAVFNKLSTCGESGRRKGLFVRFQDTDISNIPFQSYVEVPFVVERLSTCREYNNIMLEIIATCEIPATSDGSSKYQYDASYSENTHEVEILYDQIVPPSSSARAFSVSWVPAARRAK